MPGDVMGIGDFGAAVGLSVSALRFYDRADVLAPAEVDPRTGYRRYGPEQLEAGRLVARLRRTGVGVADLKVLMTERGDAQLVSDVLERHLQRLEAGLADARHELDRIRSALALPPPGSCGPMSGVLSVFEVVNVDLARAVDAVAFALPATGNDPDLEIILFELTDATLSLYATDRYRLASCSVPTLLRAGEETASFALAADSVSHICGVPHRDGTVRLELTQTTLTVVADDAEVESVPLFRGVLPNLRPLMTPPDDAQLLTGDSVDLLSALSAPTWSVLDGGGADAPVAFIAEDPDRPGRVQLVPPRLSSKNGGVAVNADYLLEAVKAGPEGSVSLSLHGQNPLAIRFGADPSTTSLLMPRRV